jgi:ornithine cyclodeaminase/alanine dehydrogenase-like protein (mu-crystallin family)
MVGAGHQAGFQLRAAARQRAFEKVVAWNLHPEMLPKLGARWRPSSACRSRRSSWTRLQRGGCDHHHHLELRAHADGGM